MPRRKQATTPRGAPAGPGTLLSIILIRRAVWWFSWVMGGLVCFIKSVDYPADRMATLMVFAIAAIAIGIWRLLVIFKRFHQ